MAKKENKDILEKKPADVVQQENKPVDVSEFIQSLPKDKRGIATQLIVGIAESRVFQGPLPAPEDFREYEAIMPGISREIVDMAKNQQTHRMELEKNIVRNEIIQSSRGQIMGFILGLMCLVGALVAAYLGVPKLAYLLGGTTLLGVVVVFVLNRLPWTSKKKEEEE